MFPQYAYALCLCDLCGHPVDARGSSGLFIFRRGEVTHVEQPPLCERCAFGVSLTAQVRWAQEEEEG